MSKTATRSRLDEAQSIARDALFILKPFVGRAEIAGSIRRGLPVVGDVDIVAEFDAANPWVRSQALAELGNALLYYAKREGPQTVHLEHEHGTSGRYPAIDLYVATPETWGMTLLVRTGSAAHNIRLAQRAGRRLPARKFTLHGIEDTAGRVIASRTEQEIFDALGLLYIEPRDREAPEFEHMVRQDES